VLVVTRKVGESLRIGDSIVVSVVRVASGAIRIGVDAPPEATIRRSELIAPRPSSRSQSTPASSPSPAMATEGQATRNPPQDSGGTDP
jgi:carbon storage regulator